MTEEAKKQQHILFRILEWAALAAVMHYCIYSILDYTTFHFEISEEYRTVTFSTISVFGFLRLLTGLLQDLRQAEERKAKRRALLKVLAALICTVPFVIVTQRFEYTALVYFPMAAFCLYGSAPNRVIKTYAACLGTALAVTVLNMLSGTIENLVYVTENGLRSSGGVAYPTNFASYFFFLLLYAWCIQKKQSLSRTILFSAAALLIAWGLFVYTRSRTSLISCVLFAAVILIDRLDARVLSQRPKTRWITKAGNGLMIGFFPLCCIGTLILTWLYGQGSSLAGTLNNQFLSDRLNQMWTSFLKYGIHPFGALTPQSGWGSKLLHYNELDFLDNSFALLLIRYGWVILIITAAVWMWMTYKAIATGHRRIAVIMTMILFHSFSEHHLPDLRYNILLVMPLCCFEKGLKPAESRGIDKREADGWIAGGVIGAAALLLLPRYLSMIRSLFSRKGWTGGGEDSIPALFFWLAILGAVAAGWYVCRRMLTSIRERKKIGKSALALLAVLVILAAGGTIWLNRQSDLAAGENDRDRIAADAAAAELITQAAAEPVYAGQQEESYKRSISGIQDRIFPPEDLARGKRGSFLLDYDDDGYQLLSTGAQYTEISPYTGLFTYDSAVKDRLESAGYTFYDCYSAEQEEKLADYAEVNGLEVTPEGGLKVKGGKQKLFAGPYLSQFAGTYRITYTLQVRDPEVLKKDSNREICEIRAAAMYGKDLRAARVLYAGEFSEDGSIVTTLDYTVGDTVGVEYKVFGRDDIEVWVERITWRQMTP